MTEPIYVTCQVDAEENPKHFFKIHTDYESVLKRQQEHFNAQRCILTDSYDNVMVSRGRLAICGSLWGDGKLIHFQTTWANIINQILM